MSEYKGLDRPFQPNWQGLVDNIRRRGTPERVYHIELFQDGEIQDAIAQRFNLLRNVRNHRLGQNQFAKKESALGIDIITFGHVIAG